MSRRRLEANPERATDRGELAFANITLDSLDKELERRGHRFARPADDFLSLLQHALANRWRHEA